MPSADLNLTRAFVAVYETGSVTAAAQRLKLSQPTVTHALNRLRRQLGDELFIRERRGVAPTTKARRAYPIFVEALNAIDSVFDVVGENDGPIAPTSFHLALSDAGEASLLPRLWAAIHAASPESTLAIQPLNIAHVEEQVLRGELDGFISGATFHSRRLARQELFTEDFVVLLAQDHPRIGEQLTSAQLTREHHVLVQGAIGHHEPPRQQRERGVRVSVEVPRYSGLPNLLRGGSAVAIVPYYVADTFAASGGLRHVPVPWDIDPVSVGVYSRHAHARSPEQSWLVRTITDALGSLTEHPVAGG